MKATAQADRSIIAVQPVRLWRGFYTDCWAKSILKALNGFNAAFIRKKANILDFEPRTSERPASIRTKWAQEIVKSHIIKEIYETNIQLDNVNSTWQLPFSFVSQGRRSATLPRPPALPFVSSMDIAADEPIKICIVGAGISGLFLGFLLDSLKLPHISYEILESSQRIGGRVYTHRFGPAEKDYYDVGAMRFPKIAPLKRAFDLFEACDIDLLPYHYEGRKCPTVFNGIFHLQGEQIESENDPFQMSISRGGMVPDRTVIEGPDVILNRAFTPFSSKLAQDFQEGFIELMKYDHMTTRDYLRQKMGLDFYSIWYMETLLSASGLYDQSLSEAVLDAMDFEYPTASGDSVEWYRIAGGTSRVIDKMEDKLARKPLRGACVVSIAYQSHGDSRPMSVQIEGESQPRKYSAVFNTASLPCMRRMTMGPGTLRPGQRAAIQSVHYDASTKVAIKFKSAWWTQYCNIQGGQASTDLPIRTCVYPSSEAGAEDPSSVLLCSYTWGQDAQRMASLLGQDAQNKELEQFLNHNLALLHQDYVDPIGGKPFGYARMLRIIKDAYEEHHAYDWYGDPCASGAFAYFGPGQFRHFYPELVRPAANGHMFLVGEACSCHHAWISGSLDSAYRGLIQYLHKLIAEGRVAPHVLPKLQASWGELGEISAEILEWQMYLSQISMR